MSSSASMSVDDEEYEEDKDDKIQPLTLYSSTVHQITPIHKYPKPSIAASAVSSAIGHATYFDQMKSFHRSNNSKNNKKTKCNRMYSYFNFLDFILQCVVFAILSFEFLTIYSMCTSTYKIYKTSNDACAGDLSECDKDTDCFYHSSICKCAPIFKYALLPAIYIILSTLRLLYILYRSCLICYSLRKGSKNQKLFVSGNVMHQSWMDRIADDCWIPLCLSSCCCCKNMARVAYLASIDQSKAFPTKTSFIIINIFKILNIAFCGLYLYFDDTVLSVFFYVIAIIGVLYLFTLIMTLHRIRLKKKAQIQKAFNSSPTLNPVMSMTMTNDE